MRNLKRSSLAIIPVAILSLAGGSVFAYDGAPMTPEVAAKREMVRKQQEQRVTPEEKKAAAEALKAERLKIYKARQAAGYPNPGDDKGAK